MEDGKDWQSILAPLLSFQAMEAFHRLEGASVTGPGQGVDHLYDGFLQFQGH